MNPFSEFFRGVKTFLAGVSWLRRHPGAFLALGVPWVLGFAALGVGWTFFVQYQDVWMARILFDRPDSWILLPVYLVAKALVYLGLLGLSLLLCLLMVNVLAAPLYEWISGKVEKDLTGSCQEMGFWASLRLIPEELKKVVMIAGVSILLLFIPGINVLSFFIAAFFIGWEFYDYPLQRRGWTLQQRWRFVRGDFWAVLGFGLWLTIPVLQLFLLPLAVAGGTMLCLDELTKRSPPVR